MAPPNPGLRRDRGSSFASRRIHYARKERQAVAGDDGEEEISLEMQAEAIQAEHVETPDWPDEADFR